MKKTKVNRAFWAGLCMALPPVPALSVSEWSAQHRVMSGESSAQPGRFVALPYQPEPMDAALDPNVSETVIQWAAQTGKSETLNNITGYFIHADPAPQLFAQPTIDLAEAYSTERIAPMIRDTPCLRKLVRDPRSRDSGNTLKSKRYPGGNLALVGANAPSGLAGRPRRVILLDEVDRYPFSAGTEGDPCALADKRAEAFPNAVKVKTSTPTVKGLSRIENLIEQSDCRHWTCSCPKCTSEQVWMWSQVKWPEGMPEEAWLECSKCAAHLTDAERIASVKAGRWVATKPFAGIRGYWLNGINTLFRSHKGFRNRLHEMAADFMKAKEGGAQTMRVWTNTFLAETYEEEAERIDASVFAGRCEEYTPETLPEAVLMITAAADVQGNRIEVEFFGWGKDEECWHIEKRVLDGDPEQDEVWNALDEQFSRKFTRDDGCEIEAQRAFVDFRYKNRRVLAFCAPRIGRGIYPCGGLNRVGTTVPPILPAKPSRNNRAKIPHWMVGVTVAKAAIYDRLQLPTPGPRSVHFPVGYGYDEAHFRQLVSERRRTRYSYGQPYTIFEPEKAGQRNEALDLNVYGLAALVSVGPVAWTKLAENRLKSIPEKPAQEPVEVVASPDAKATKVVAENKPQQPAKPIRPRRGGGWANRW